KSGEIFLAGLFGRSRDGYFAVVSGCWRRGGGRVGLDLLAGRGRQRDDQHRPQKRSREMSMSHVVLTPFGQTYPFGEIDAGLCGWGRENMHGLPRQSRTL